MPQPTHPIGIYIHVPFCTTKCPYCGFYKTIYSPQKKQAFITALCQEIEGFKNVPNLPSIQSIFFGGGTPSLLDKQDFTKIFATLHQHFSLQNTCEITLEVNPETVSSQTLTHWKDVGINRLSIGVQSFRDEDLTFLGREHTTHTIVHALDLIQHANITNFNLDLMFSLKTLQSPALQSNLEKALSYNPPHLSTYALSIEPGTPFEKQRKTPTPSDEELEQYQRIQATLQHAGYIHYEVSAFAKPGYECHHNLRYWRYEPYIGFGPSAHSFFQGKRFENKASLTAYLKNPVSAYFSKDAISLSIEEQTLEYLMATLRLEEGFSLTHFTTHYPQTTTALHLKHIEKLKNLGLLQVKNDRISTTPKGRYLLNEVLLEFMP